MKQPTTEEVAKTLGITHDMAREYLMERRYHGVTHEEVGEGRGFE